MAYAMKGTVFGIGVGPGDPELITVKAIRLIRENEIIVVPGKKAEDSAAYKIAVQIIPELARKKVVAVNMPMTKDMNAANAEHIKAAGVMKKYLDEGKNVVYLTLGDPTIYSSFFYLQRILEKDGYEVELISGVPSFCAAAARLNIPLAVQNEAIHIIPGTNSIEDVPGEGTCVMMKSGSRMGAVKEMLQKCGRNVCAVADCGMKTEQIYKSVEEIPDNASYFTVVIARDDKAEIFSAV